MAAHLDGLNIHLRLARISCKQLTVNGHSAGSKRPAQTDPPSVPITALFPDGNFPEGEWQSYKDECVPLMPDLP